MSKFGKYNEIIQLQIERRPENKRRQPFTWELFLGKGKPFEMLACFNDAFNNSSINVRYYS